MRSDTWVTIRWRRLIDSHFMMRDVKRGDRSEKKILSCVTSHHVVSSQESGVRGESQGLKIAVRC